MPSKKDKPTIPPEKLALYDQLVATHLEIERKGVTTPYTSANGNMFSFLSEDGTLALRLPKADREAFIEKYGTTLMEAYGAIMKEYVRVPDALLSDTGALAPYLAISYHYVMSLKPKPTKKK